MQPIIKREKLKSSLIKKTAEDLSIPESTVETVVDFISKDIHNQTLTNNEVEISGFGKFIFSKAKAKRRIDYLEKSIEMMKAELEGGILSEKELGAIYSRLKKEEQILNRIKAKL
jgi:nucleoid DNA-binding protein